LTKTVSISCNNNNDYLFYLPLVSWAWNKLGWDVLCFKTGGDTDQSKFVESKTTANIIKLEEIEGVRNETLTQISRLYAFNYVDGYIMTSDVDMMPLSNYWSVNENEITTWGRDLTDYHYPMCYIGASKENWVHIMGINGILEDLQGSKYKSDKWEEWWQVDQDIITERLFKKNVIRVDRGVDKISGYPLGRVDRGSWINSQVQKDRIDCHMLREGYKEDNFYKTMKVLIQNFNPKQFEIDFFVDYRNEFVKYL
jgi:hypothetical protein